jgi:hypothetical protein
MRAAGSALALAALLVLAGCNAPFVQSGDQTTVEGPAGETPAETATPRPGADSVDPGDQVIYPDQRRTMTPVEPQATPESQAEEVPVSGDDLPVDATRVFSRVEALAGTQAEPPEVSVSDGFGGGSYTRTQDDSFEAMLGIGAPEPVDEAEGAVQVGGATFPSGRVTLANEGGSANDFERTLAHEYAHVVQFDLGAMEWIRDGMPADRRETSDGQLAESSVVEGGATYLSTQYGIRYQPGFSTETTQILRIYRNASAGTRLVWAPYLYGSLYIQDRIASPNLLWTVYRLPPDTTEQVLHGGNDQPVPLDVRSTGSGYDEPWEVSERDSRGELFVRILLRTELEAERAAHAATGWGNDRVLLYERDFEETAFVWTLRWDDATNATEFREAFEAYLNDRGTLEDGRWDVGENEFRLESVDDRTIAVVAGPSDFVTGVEITDRGDTVEVTPPEDAGEPETPTADPDGDDGDDTGENPWGGNPGEGGDDETPRGDEDDESDGDGADDGDGITDPLLP